MKSVEISDNLTYVKYELNRDFLQKQIKDNLLDISDVAKAADVKIGLEFEFYLNNKDSSGDENLDRLLKIGLSTFVDELMYIPVGCEKKKHKDVWYLEQDDSLSGEFGFELVSPLLDLESGKFYIEQVSDIINYLGYTTDECGLHIHISSSKLDDIDINKLILLENEAKILSNWEQRGNYNKNIFNYFKVTEPDVFKSVFKDLGRNYNYIQRFDGNCESGNHVELRCFGGEGYQDRSNKILENLTDFVDGAFISSCSAEIGCEHYNELLMRHLNEFGYGFVKPVSFLDIKDSVDSFLAENSMATRVDTEDFIFGELLPELENNNQVVPIYGIYKDFDVYLDNDRNQNVFDQNRDALVDGYVGDKNVETAIKTQGL